jgi:hypothetical protein
MCGTQSTNASADYSYLFRRQASFYSINWQKNLANKADVYFFVTGMVFLPVHTTNNIKHNGSCIV